MNSESLAIVTPDIQNKPFPHSYETPQKPWYIYIDMQI